MERLVGLARAITRQRRLTILRLLAGGDVASHVLLAMVLETPQDVVRTDLAWLAENGLVRIQQIGGLHFASLTQRGLETAAGLVETPGVESPGRRRARRARDRKCRRRPATRTHGA
ncbi:MAG: helix-turn-helix transcriptional regulator [Candidatus Binataceae bacterium]